MKKLLSVICVLIFAAVTGNAQTNKPSLKNAVYVEFFGNGFLGSVNYERQIFSKPYLAARAGIGLYGLRDKSATFNVGLNYLLPLGRLWFVDFGAGAVYSQNDGASYTIVDYNPGFNPPQNTISIAPSVGIRKHIASKWLVRATAVPMFNKLGFIPSVGLSLGRLF